VVLLVYALTRARGVNQLWSLLIMLVTVFGTLANTVPRPQMVTFCLILLTALLLEKGKWPWALAVVAIGVNIHGGIWPMYVILFIFYEFPKRWWIVGLAVLATLLNPHPDGVFFYPFGALLNPETASIREFVPTALWTRKGDFVMYILVILAIWGKRIKLRDTLMAGALFVLSMMAIRHIQWFYLLILPILAPYIARDTIDLSWAKAQLRRLRLRFGLTPPVPDEVAFGDAAAGVEGVPPDGSEEGGDEPGPASGSRMGRSRLPELLLVGALSAAVLFLGARAYRQEVDVHKYYPRDLIPYLKLHNVKRLYNAWHEGGYLILYGIQPMIDGRGDPFGPERPGDLNMMADFSASWQTQRDTHYFMDKYKIDYVLIPGSTLLIAIAHDPAFVLLKQTETHALFKYDPKAASGASSTTTETAPAAQSGGISNSLRNAVESGTETATPPSP
jgi:hypothetical protein